MLIGVLPYFVFLAIVMLIFQRQTQEKSYSMVTAPMILTLVVMILFAGLRDKTVGTDTSGYTRSFMNVVSRSLSDDTMEALKSEPGFFFLMRFVRLFSDDYWVMLSVIAAISYSIVLYAINRYSENKILSLFVYITLGYYTFCFNAARQAIALSIYLMALPCIYDRKFTRYCVLVCIAALFHKSVLISIPLYFLFTMKYSWKSVLMTVIAAVIVSQLLPALLSSASEIQSKYRLYSTANASGGYLLTTFYTLLALFFVFKRSEVSIRERREYDIFLQMLICGSVIYLIVVLSGAYIELTRFAAYFQIASIFLFAKLYNSHEKLINPSLMTIIYISCLAYFFIFLTRMAALTPYKFNTTL